jgi:hypothetical protein
LYIFLPRAPFARTKIRIETALSKCHTGCNNKQILQSAGRARGRGRLILSSYFNEQFHGSVVSLRDSTASHIALTKRRFASGAQADRMQAANQPIR